MKRKNTRLPLLKVVTEDGIVHVDVATRIVDRSVASAMCGAITREANSVGGRPRLIMNLGSLTRATPGAGFYALRQIKQLDPAAIAFYGGHRFMRAFARTVLRVAGFHRYSSFDSVEEARVWLAESDRA